MSRSRLYINSVPGKLAGVAEGYPAAMAFSRMRLVTRMSCALMTTFLLSLAASVRSTVPGGVSKSCFSVLTVDLKTVPSVSRTMILYRTSHPACVKSAD